MLPQTQSPLIFGATKESILNDVEQQIAATNATWDGILASVDTGTACWDNTVLPIIRAENEQLCVERHLLFYKSTHPDAELRAASDAAGRLVDNQTVEIYARADMWALVSTVKDQLDADPLAYDAESHYYMEKLLRKFTVSGCGLEDGGATKARFMECKRRIKDIQRECLTNHHNESTREWFLREDLVGVPESFLSRLEGNDDDQSGVWVSTKTVQSSQVIRHAKKETTRKRMFYAVQNKMPSNQAALFRELLLLRDEAARLLGYPHHAALQISGKMLRDHEVVRKFLAETEARLRKEGANNIKALLDIKRADLAAGVGELDPEAHPDHVFFWDQTYLAHIQDEQSRSAKVDLSDYFELHHTLETLLRLFEGLFDIEFRRVSTKEQEEMGQGKPLVWHEDVLMYTVWDSDAAFRGYAYFDLHPRPGKFTHTGGHWSLQPSFIKGDKTRHRASSALVMNYLKTPGKPTLLSVGNARSLFHEIGHLVHSLCTEAQYAASHWVDRDFVEAPAEMFEKFWDDPRIIQRVSHHYALLSPDFERAWRDTLPPDDTATVQALPAPKLPDDVAASVASADKKRSGVRSALWNMFFAQYDLLVHSPASRAALEQTNFTETYNRMKAEILGVAGGEALGDGWEWGHGETIFRAIIGNYDAGYYAYVFGDILARDIFTTGFESNPLDPEAGRRYRDMVLRLGGSQPEMKTITEYLGRQPDAEAYFAKLGV